jgi:uncharacterized repeat protein (TIGR04076 family)
LHTVQITVLRRLSNPDLVERHCEPDVTIPCPVFEEGQEFIVQGSVQPDGFCSAAWQDLYKSFRILRHGGDMAGWMKNHDTIIACCGDGLRPVVFELKRIVN